MKIQNPHDKFFKEVFSNIEVAKDFIINYVPKEIVEIIDLDTLSLQKDSFINEQLKEVYSDMLFKAKINNYEGYIYFLFEHKSYVSRQTALQLLRYVVEIWDMNIKKEGVGKLPVIIPLVIYHGNERWNIRNDLGTIIEGYEELKEEVKRYIPNFEYLLYDLSSYEDEDIKGQVLLRIMISALRDITIKDAKGMIDAVIKVASCLAELQDKQTGLQYFETYLRYIFSTDKGMTKQDFESIKRGVEKILVEGSEYTMTLADIFREEGREEGIKKGIKEGERMALVKSIIKVLTKKFGILPDEIKNRIEVLDIATLELMFDEALDFTSLEEIKKYL
ncbi:Rpn family recombination-promoting nuclease/putative transposase [Caloramator proteoclasticus]|uniref:Transposase (putative) YhgA-like domain-containing protein n=1 Tax=Caloramator proteoclasticus DSM 10124 TaxID=1121262 RepID=A0A1M4Z3B9_9CLOT|nr:Rpn family recombination-promoting nuclease/putative transposase [Caloramator proteoclasticus]SHF12553.1 conserved hypothetical protein (putative transposase or invertase) [Caloramator proteoclasticus DSM 10124]